jgi:hypothetical protein
MTDTRVLHYLLLAAAVFLFTRLSLDAVILGALALYFYQQWRK